MLEKTMQCGQWTRAPVKLQSDTLCCAEAPVLPTGDKLDGFPPQVLLEKPWKEQGGRPLWKAPFSLGPRIHGLKWPLGHSGSDNPSQTPSHSVFLHQAAAHKQAELRSQCHSVPDGVLQAKSFPGVQKEQRAVGSRGREASIL